MSTISIPDEPKKNGVCTVTLRLWLSELHLHALKQPITVRPSCQTHPAHGNTEQAPLAVPSPGPESSLDTASIQMASTRVNTCTSHTHTHVMTDSYIKDLVLFFKARFLIHYALHEMFHLFNNGGLKIIQHVASSQQVCWFFPNLEREKSTGLLAAAHTLPVNSFKFHWTRTVQTPLNYELFISVIAI